MATRSRALIVLAVATVVSAAAAWASWREGVYPTLANGRLPLTGAAIVSVLLWLGLTGAAKLAKRSEEGPRSLRQVELAASLLIAVIAALAWASDGASVLVSLGIVGFGLTLALQRPILSFAGWMSIFIGRMFREGDRIEAGDVQGDVLAIGLWNTKLWEIGGPTSTTPGRPTGRIRTVSNAHFLEQTVANATDDTPVVFDEFVVNVAFESDQELAQELLKLTGEAVLDPGQHKRLARDYAKLTAGLAIEKGFPDHPVTLAESKPSWMEYRLRYLVDARRASRVQSALTREWNDRCAPHSDTLFPVYNRSQSQRINALGKPMDQG